jgi:alpha-methylacyl-CoA racemase
MGQGINFAPMTGQLQRSADPQAKGPLKGVRVVELAGIGPAPFACMLLADLGADVIRVDRPGAAQVAGAGRGNRQVLHRGRPVLSLDLKQAPERDRLLALVRQADALVEGFRPGVMERLGLGPDTCLGANPRLVYARMTGWGQHGPLALAAGHDINYIAITGALHAIGPRHGRPMPPLNLVGDFGGGALYLAFGVVSALLEARGSGQGQVVDAAIVDGTLSLMAMMYSRMAEGLWHDRRESNLLDGGAPWYGTYETADGKFVAVGAIEPQFYEELRQRAGLAAEGLPDAKARLSPGTWDAQCERLARLFKQRTRDQWCALLEGSDACFAPVLGMNEAPLHPHNQARQNMVQLDGSLQPAPAPRFSRTPGAIQPTAGPGAESGEERAARWLRT